MRVVGSRQDAAAAEPFHTATIDGLPVRFYRSPLDEPDFPWCAFVDALTLAAISPDGREDVIDKWRETWPDMIRTLSDGTIIVPDIAVVGMFQWAADLGWEQANDLLHAYDEQARLAFAVQHAHLPIEEYRAVAQKAALRHMPVEPGMQSVN